MHRAPKGNKQADVNRGASEPGAEAREGPEEQHVLAADDALVQVRHLRLPDARPLLVQGPGSPLGVFRLLGGPLRGSSG